MSFTSKLAGTLSARLSIIILSGITGIVIARVLQPELRGAYYVVVTIAGICIVVAHLSLERAHIYLWAKGERAATLTANAVIVGLVLGSLTAGGAFVLILALGPGVIPIQHYGLLAIALAAVPLGVVSLYLNNLVTLQDRIGRVNKASALAAVAQSGALLALAARHHLTVASVVIIWAVATALPLTVTLNVLRVRPRDFSIGLALSSIAMGARYHLGLAFLYLLWRVDILMLASQVSRAEVGRYTLAVTLAEMVLLFSESLAAVVLPYQAVGTVSDAARLTARVSGINLLMSVLGLAAVAVSAPLIVPVVYGQAYAGAIAPLWALIPGVSALAASNGISPYLVRLGRPLLLSGCAAAALGCNIVLNLFFIPLWGITGAALASSVAYILLAALHVRWLKRSGGLQWREFALTAGEVKAGARNLWAQAPWRSPSTVARYMADYPEAHR